MRLEDVLQTNRFRNEQHKASLNILFSAYWLKSNLSYAIKDGDLTMEQYNVMRILKGKHPEKMCIKDIAGRMIERNSNVPRIIDKLLAKKLVKRSVSKTDKRETLVALTEKGLTNVESTTQVLNALSDSLIKLTEAEAGILNDLLEKMRLGSD